MAEVLLLFTTQVSLATWSTVAEPRDQAVQLSSLSRLLKSCGTTTSSGFLPELRAAAASYLSHVVQLLATWATWSSCFLPEPHGPAVPNLSHVVQLYPTWAKWFSCPYVSHVIQLFPTWSTWSSCFSSEPRPPSCLPHESRDLAVSYTGYEV